MRDAHGRYRAAGLADQNQSLEQMTAKPTGHFLEMRLQSLRIQLMKQPCLLRPEAETNQKTTQAGETMTSL